MEFEYPNYERNTDLCAAGNVIAKWRAYVMHYHKV